MGEVVRLEHGSGGAASRELIDRCIYPHFHGKEYPELSDATAFTLDEGGFLTTDIYVIDPPVFPGGNIGRLAVLGTCNDLAVAGGRPAFLTVGLVLEEGFPLDVLDTILASLAQASSETGAVVLSGDTKVVPAGKGGGIFINTAGIGERVFPHSLTPRRVQTGDRVIVTGPIGSHGISILSAREGLDIGKDIQSDLAFLFPLCKILFSYGDSLRFARDATRGGVAAILNEACRENRFGILAREEAFPVVEEVRVAADLLGLDPLEIANEGVMLAVLASETADDACQKLRKHPLGRMSRIVGEITGENTGRVVLETRIGGRRILDLPRGLLLPRIC